jgi:hypothetical protein
MDRINECFREHTTFQRVHLHLIIPHPLRRGLNVKPGDLKDVLERTVLQLRSIRGLSESVINVTIEVPYNPKAFLKLSRSFRETCDGFKYGAEQYFSNFEAIVLYCDANLDSKLRSKHAG